MENGKLNFYKDNNLLKNYGSSFVINQNNMELTTMCLSMAETT